MKRSILSPLNDTTIVYVSYGSNLRKITKNEKETFSFTGGVLYEDLLISFFTKYPNVFKKTMPGTLLQRLNGGDVLPGQRLATGDYIELEISSLRDLQCKLKKDIKTCIIKNKLPIKVNQILEFIFQEENTDVDNLFSSFAEPYEEFFETEDEFEYYVHLLWQSWNMFPHMELDNKTPAEIFHKEILKNETRFLKGKLKINEDK